MPSRIGKKDESRYIRELRDEKWINHSFFFFLSLPLRWNVVYIQMYSWAEQKIGLKHCVTHTSSGWVRSESDLNTSLYSLKTYLLRRRKNFFSAHISRRAYREKKFAWQRSLMKPKLHETWEKPKIDTFRCPSHVKRYITSCKSIQRKCINRVSISHFSS